MLYREREGGTVEGAEPGGEPETGGSGAESTEPSESSAPPAPEPGERADAAPPDSLLAKIQAHTHVADLLRSVRAACAGGRDRPMPGALREQLRALPDHLVALNARFSAGSLRNLLARLESGRLSVRAAASALEDLATRLADELAQVRVVLVPSGQANGDGEPAFGEAVERRFPEAAHDIEEAAACLAVRRATASVMHAANAMRHGLAAIARFDAAPKPVEPSWARMIAAAEGSPELIDALAGLRRVWRGRGPVAASKYTEEEAEAILAAVGGFLRVLADRPSPAEA